LIFDEDFAVGQGSFVDFATFFEKSGVGRAQEKLLTMRVSPMTAKSNADDEVRKVTARARRFLADRGITCAVPIHREDAARFMVEFAILEKEFVEEMGLARKGIKDRHDALRQLANSQRLKPFPESVS
jgi:hypothetical protein